MGADACGGLAGLFKPSLGLATGSCTSHNRLMYVWALYICFEEDIWTWRNLSVELVPATAVSEIAGSGRVSLDGLYAVHKALLGRSSWSVVPQLTDTRG